MNIKISRFPQNPGDRFRTSPELSTDLLVSVSLFISFSVRFQWL